MAQKQYSPIDMQNLEIWNLKLQSLASAPVAGIGPGSVYFDTVAGKIRFRNASTWVDPTDRAAHTGTQTASTISDLAAVVKAYKLNEFAAPTADVSMGGAKILNLMKGSAGTEAANVQNITDALALLRLNTIAAAADVAFGGFKATGLADGTAADHAATYGQLLNLQNGTDWKSSVRAATTANIALTGIQTIDGVTLVAGDRVLVRANTTASQNGIWVVASGAWTRATDADANGKLTPATAVFVEEGTTWADTQHRITTDGAIVVGTTAIAWGQFGAGSTYTNGTGLLLTGNTFSIDPAYGVTRKLGFNVGDNTNTTIALTHNLNTYDVQVTVYDATTRENVYCDISRSSLNAVSLGFATAPATNALRAVVMG